LRRQVVIKGLIKHLDNRSLLCEKVRLYSNDYVVDGEKNDALNRGEETGKHNEFWE